MLLLFSNFIFCDMIKITVIGKVSNDMLAIPLCLFACLFLLPSERL